MAQKAGAESLRISCSGCGRDLGHKGPDEAPQGICVSCLEWLKAQEDQYSDWPLPSVRVPVFGEKTKRRRRKR